MQHCLWYIFKILGSKSYINNIDPYGWFQWFLYWFGRRLHDDKTQIKRWNSKVNRFKGRLFSIIKKLNGRFNDY